MLIALKKYFIKLCAINRYQLSYLLHDECPDTKMMIYFALPTYLISDVGL